MSTSEMRIIGFERRWNSVEALARLAGASDDEAERLECLFIHELPRTCIERESDEPCPVCWARSEFVRMNG